MKEYQFKREGVWLDVHATTPEEAVKIINSQLHLLDEPLQSPGLIRRVLIDVRKEFSVEDIAATYDLEPGELESFEPNIESEAGAGCPAPTCSHLFSVGDIVQHRTSRQIGIVRRVHTGTSVNPTHANPFNCTMTLESLEQLRVAAQNPCQHEFIDVYDVSVGFGEDVQGVEGFLLIANTESSNAETNKGEI